MKKWIFITVALGVVVAGAGFAVKKFWMGAKDAKQYRTASVDRGNVVQTVRATGIVAPLRLVQVGAQVNGPLRKLYIDYNVKVKEGDLIAQIDPTTYEARLAQDSANATQSIAQVEQVQAKLVQAENELERSRKLVARQMISQGDMDTAVANRDSLLAQMKSAKAAVDQAKAAMAMSQANLDYTTIKAPVDGVVISRNIDEGQTVVATMSAQMICTIATDLKDIQVESSIPEADVGKIKVGQPVSFTVDAFDLTFTGEVAQIRMSAATVQNVVTYPVIVRAANPDGKLFPGMTANITCEVSRRENVLRVPNAALRFKPEDFVLAKQPEATAAATNNVAAGTGRGGGDRGERKGRGGMRKQKLWLQESADAELKMADVLVGVTDGAFTEVKEGADLKEGQLVVTGVMVAGEKQDKVSNPFMPQMPGGGRR